MMNLTLFSVTDDCNSDSDYREYSANLFSQTHWENPLFLGKGQTLTCRNSYFTIRKKIIRGHSKYFGSYLLMGKFK